MLKFLRVFFLLADVQAMRTTYFAMEKMEKFQQETFLGLLMLISICWLLRQSTFSPIDKVFNNPINFVISLTFCVYSLKFWIVPIIQFLLPWFQMRHFGNSDEAM